MKIILLALSILASQISFAQLTSPIRVKAGEDLYAKIAKEIYQYPDFTKGMVSFRNGMVNLAFFNYNMLIGEIQFIDAKGDTLSLANELTIKYVTIGVDSFFYSSGYLQQIAGNDEAKLVKKQKLKMVDQQKIGAYDQPSSTGSITAYNSISGNLKNFKLDVRQDVILAKQTNFLLGDKYYNFFKPSKKNLLKFFYKKEKELTNYFKNNEVDFNKEDDLTKLIAVLKNS